MTRKKYPSEVNTKTVRLNIGDWQVLNEISRSHNITFAEAFHQLMTEISKREPAPVTSRAQIPMPVTFRAQIPIPVTAQMSLNPILKAKVISTNVQLRATVAKGGSSNGAKQV